MGEGIDDRRVDDCLLGLKKKGVKIMRVVVVYWSGTGNTEKMAKAVFEGAKQAGADVEIVTAAAFQTDRAYDAYAFGCPSMGSEELEDAEFAPMFAAFESKLAGASIALFGSYDWGDGEWMRNWADRCRSLGAQMAAEPVICQGEPEEEGIASCQNLGKALVS